MAIRNLGVKYNMSDPNLDTTVKEKYIKEKDTK